MTKVGMKNHKRINHGENSNPKYTCEECNEVLATELDYLDHKNKHTGKLFSSSTSVLIKI